MRLLAIDTALEACAVAVFDTDLGMLASESLPMKRGHAEALMPLIARVMDDARAEFDQLDRIVVTVGPGSFTGLRVGISAARGIALASGRPAIGLSTLAAYAAPHIAPDGTAAIVAAIDARHANVYVQVFGSDGQTRVAPRLAPIGDAVHAAMATPAYIVGSAADAILAQWPEGEPLPLLVQSSPAPDIAWVARLGAAAQASDNLPKPLYLQAPDAKPQDAARLPRR